MHHKTAKDEQFPVCFLASGRVKDIISTYYEASRFADDIADDPLLSSSEKLHRLSAVRQAFLIPFQGDDLPIIRKLGMIFAKENLDASLYLDLLTAFEQDAVGCSVRVFEELVQYCRYSAAPVGRFMLAVYGEHPMTYLPGESLCIVLQILNHLGDIKHDLSLLKRCYVPLDMLQRHKVKISDLGLSYSSAEVRALLSELVDKTAAIMSDATILPSLIKDFRLRFEVCVIISLTNSMLKQYKNADILQSPPHVGKAVWIKSLVSGFFEALFGSGRFKGLVL